jgi:hypothetical protein
LEKCTGEKFEMFVQNDWNLQLTVDHVIRAQGADPASIRARRPVVVEAAEWALKEGLPLLEPRVVFDQVTTGAMRHERLELDGGEPKGKRVLSGKLIAQHLGPASAVAVLVCTIGPVLEATVSELMTSDPLLGLAMDALGSTAVEALASQACNYVEAQAARQGLQTTLPLSPGMIGWPVDIGQDQIFNLVDTRQIGVTLTASSQMNPRKSLSMVLGIGANVTQAGRTCDYCSLSETCRYQNHYTLEGS